MKISLSLVGLFALVAGAQVACSSTPTPIDGAGGTPGAGGAASGGAANGTGGGDATNLLFDGNTAWVDGDGNTVGIQGAFFILEDSVKDAEAVSDTLMHSDFDAVTGGTDVDNVSKFDDLTLKPCISGTAVQVTDEAGMTGCNAAGPEDMAGACQWSAQWGGGIGLNLNETGGDDSMQSPWDALANSVTGFSFTVSGEAGGAELRFKAKNEGSDEDFCKKFTVVPGTPIKIALAELKHMCWGSDGTEVLGLTNISQLQWQVVTDAAASHTVTNLCIENLSWY